MLDWKLEDGTPIDVDDIDNLPISDWEKLEIDYDGRYQIDKLLDILENAIQEFEAQMGLRMAARLSEVINRLAKHLITIFSTISVGVAVTPIPVSDIYVLLLQSVMITMIRIIFNWRRSLA